MGDERGRPGAVWLTLGLAACMWFIMFYLHAFNFWVSMAIAAAVRGAVAGGTALWLAKDVIQEHHDNKADHKGVGGRLRCQALLGLGDDLVANDKEHGPGGKGKP